MGASTGEFVKNIARYLSTSPKPNTEQKRLLQNEVIKFIQRLTEPRQIYFFGSILEDRFDSFSDIDVIAVYDSDEMADQARRLLYRSPRPDLGHSLEIFCVSEKVFAEKSEIGGIYWIARHHGQASI